MTVGMAGGSEHVQKIFPTNMKVKQNPGVEGTNFDKYNIIFHLHDSRSNRNGNVDQVS